MRAPSRSYTARVYSPVSRISAVRALRPMLKPRYGLCDARGPCAAMAEGVYFPTKVITLMPGMDQLNPSPETATGSRAVSFTASDVSQGVTDETETPLRTNFWVTAAEVSLKATMAKVPEESLR